MAGPVPVVDYLLGKPPIANPDGSVPAVATGCTPVAGPGAGDFAALVQALRFSGGAHVSATPAPNLFDARRFCVRLVMRVTSVVTARGNLFESALPACSLQVVPPSGRGQFRILGWIHNARNGWDGVDTANRLDLQINTWFALDFVCDIDTVALFVNGNLVALSAFPDGTPVPSSSADFVLGIHPDLKRWPFTGEIAQAQVWNGIPPALEQVLDDARGGPEWHIRLKQNTLLPGAVLGASQGDIRYDAASGMRLQRFANATICHATGLPGAYMIHGAIRDRWEQGNGLAKLLGPLLSDEVAARAPGSRRSVFERGAIYWSSGTGAWEITGRPYIDYEQMGGSVSVLGLPEGPTGKFPGGTVQGFQGGQLYYRNGATRAYEVHGAILWSFLATGGLAAWGYPVSDEEDVRLAPSNSIAPPPTGARQSRFEWQNTTFLWSAATGAHQVQGAIRDAYLNAGGPGVPNDNQFNGLGLPITDEIDWPAWAGFGRFNGFEHGGVVWRGGLAQACPAFQIKLGLVQTEEDEGAGQDENDLYFRINLTIGGRTVYAQRIPNRGSFGDDNSRDLDLLIDHLIVPNDPELRVELSVEVWDEDDTSGDDHLGTLTKELNIANAWGLFDNDKGVFVATGLDEVKRFEWQVQARQPPEAARDFWNTGNPKTPTLIYPQYAAAFTDIDDDPEFTDPSDWAQRDVFARRVKRIAANGNCFGFCAEALHAWFGHGVGMPLARFQPADWESIRNTVNVKHIYQVGSDVLAHFQDQMEDRMKPRAIFQETRQRASAGDPCAICVYTGNYAGAGHCVLPIAWDDTGLLWTIQCFDPNNGSAPVQLTIDPNNDSYILVSATTVYSGTMLFAPWSALNHRQCSPAWDPNMLLLGLLMCVVGSDASTSGITDSVGDNLWLPDNVVDEQSSGAGQFAPVSTMDGQLDGEILLRRVRPENDFWSRPRDVLDLSVDAVQRQSIAGLAAQTRAHTDAACSNPQPLPPRLMRALAGATLSPATLALTMRDLLHGLVSDTADLEPEVHKIRDWLGRQSTSRGPDFVHTLRGVRRGQFDYLTRWQLTATRMRCAIERDERHRLEAGGLSGRMPLYKLTTQRDKLVSVEHTVRLGRGSDYARISLGNLPARAGLSLNVSVRAGLAAVDVLTAGDRVDVPVLLETWHGNQRREQRFMAVIEGGMRLTPALHEPGAALKQARIATLFGEAGEATLLRATGS